MTCVGERMKMMDRLGAPWPLRRLCLWWLFLVGVCWVHEDDFHRMLDPELRPLGAAFFLPDFFQDYGSARNRLEGIPVYAPHAVAVARYLGRQMSPGHPCFLDYNAHPPTSVLLALPLGWLEFSQAFAVWNILSLACLAASLYLLARGLALPWTWEWIVPLATILLACRPFWHQMIQGQMNLMLLLMLTSCWAAARAGRPYLAGGMLAVAAAVKLYPAFMLVYFLGRKDYRAIAATFGFWVLIGTATIMILGWDSCLGFFRDVLPVTSGFRRHCVNMLLVGFWHRLFDNPTVDDVPDDSFFGPALAWALTALSVAAIAWAVLRSARRAATTEAADCAYGLAVIGALLASPITWDHYLLLLMLPLAFDRRWWPAACSGNLFVLLLGLLFMLDPRLVIRHVQILYNASPPASLEDPSAWNAMTALAVYPAALLTFFLVSRRQRRRPRAGECAIAALPGS